MFKEIHHWLQHRAGYRFASREIEAFSDHLHSDEEVLASRKRLLQQRAAMLGCPFGQGWSKRWAEFGASEARQGKCQIERFDCRGYDLGWSQQIFERQEYGWHNPRLEKQREKLHKQP